MVRVNWFKGIKRAVMAAVTVVCVSAGASAQKAEVQVGYGGYTQMDASDCHDGWDHVNTAWGAVTAGVNFQINRKMWIGPSYTFSSTTTKGGPHHSSIAYHAIMLNGRYEYYRNSIISLYAHLGLGAEISHMMPRHDDAYNKAYFAYQITPVGAQFGISRAAYMFAELGYGAQGLLQVGFRFRL
ncbi:MAG: porin family protein [[Clostridium] fimetarium]|nr:porin family protein [Alistipes timonensis]MCM1405955.1 porin family protein [[Clostridium] fimetarium]